MSSGKEKKKGKAEPDISEIEVKQDDVHSLVSKWMDDTLGLSESEKGSDDDDDNHEEVDSEVRLPRVGLGAEAKAEKGAWKKNEAAAEKLEPGARGVAERLVRQAQRAKAGDNASQLGVKRLRANADDDDDGDSRLGTIMKLSKKSKKAKSGKDAVTVIMEQKQKKRERKAAAKAAKAAASVAEEVGEKDTEKKDDEVEQVDQQDEEEKEKEAPPQKKPKTGEPFADGDDMILLPPMETPKPAWKQKKDSYSERNKSFNGNGKPKKERYVRPENVPQRSAKIKYQKGEDGQMRKRTKTRSKQKNLRRDHRPLEKKPNSIPIPPQNTHKTFADDD